MIRYRNRFKVIDGEHVWREWHAGKSLSKISYELANKGILGKQHGPLHVTSLEHSAWFWAFENLKEAGEMFKRHQIEAFANTITDDEWLEYCVRRARVLRRATPRKLKEWIERNGLQKYAH